MDLEERINQFQAMAEADPGNEMAHFSLGNVLLQAGKPDEAGESFERAANANPEMSKAYQMAGQACMAAGDTDRAAAILTNGYKSAAMRRWVEWWLVEDVRVLWSSVSIKKQHGLM